MKQLLFLGRVIVALLFLLLGFDQLFHWKIYHEMSVTHFDKLIALSEGLSSSLYHFLHAISPLLSLLASLFEIALGICLLVRYRLLWTGSIALVVYFFFVLVYYPFYLFESADFFLVGRDLLFVLFQMVCILFCLIDGLHKKEDVAPSED